MLEPLAASVLTSFLHVRPPAVPSSASQSALRTMSRALPPGFFTPHPRRAKGKERACASEGCLAYGSSCTEGTSSAVASSSGVHRPKLCRKFSYVLSKPLRDRPASERAFQTANDYDVSVISAHLPILLEDGHPLYIPGPLVAA